MKIKIAVITFLILGVNIYSQNFTNGFNFSLPYDDTATVKFLPVFNNPVIDNQNFISINSSGKFTYKGEVIRFWGANLVAGGAFPEKTLAPSIAGRLRKLGFNLIRFHHMDNPWTSQSLFEYGSDTRHLNATSLDRLEYLISKLKVNGVFANINLNVSRQFKTADGIPYADSLVEMAKGVSLFDPKLIALQKEYACQLLTHVNPYTGLSLANDPVMAMLEIVNENSLYRIWRSNQAKLQSEGGYLTFYHNHMLDTMWNTFIKERYSTTTALQTAWNAGLTPPGNNKIRNNSFEEAAINNYWILEQNNGTAAYFQKDNTQFYTGSASAKVTVTTATGTSWHLQFKQNGITLSKDTSYTIEFAAKSNGSKVIDVSLMRDDSPYTLYGGTRVTLTTEWKVYTITIRPSESISTGRVSFQIPALGNYWFDDVKLYSAKTQVLLSGESIESANIRRIAFIEAGSFSDKRVQDMSEFYITVQNNFFADMKNYLKNSLGVKCPIVGTNWNTGPADMMVQNEMDYIDNHSYWDHPNFPNIPWSSTDWTIQNTSMIKDLNGGTIPSLFSGIPTANKPYTISEYNHPFPNRFQTEAPLIISSYSSFHDADGIMFFDYNSGSSFANDVVTSYFSIDRNNALMALMPSCAYSFRNSLISEALQQIIINYKKEDVLNLPKIDAGAWEGISLFDKKLSLLHSVRTGSYNAGVSTDFKGLPAVNTTIYKTDTDELTWNTNGIFTAGSKYFSGASGALNTMGNIQAGNMLIINAKDFATITWLPLTDDSLSVSQRSLLTVSTKQQNTNMIWDGTNTIHDKWGTAPTQISPLTAYLQLKMYADSVYIYPLDNKGKESNYTRILPSSPNNFIVTINQGTTNTLWFGLEKFGNGTLTPVNDVKAAINDFQLEQNYPNPFNGSTYFNYFLPCESDVSIDIFDILGNKVRTLLNEKMPSGRYSISWDSKSDSGFTVTSGVYLFKLTAGKYSGIKKLVLLK
ncbi:MAG: carbohydrate binding domain-containing protein [Methanococcaceae archaeon]